MSEGAGVGMHRASIRHGAGGVPSARVLGRRGPSARVRRRVQLMCAQCVSGECQYLPVWLGARLDELVDLVDDPVEEVRVDGLDDCVPHSLGLGLRVLDRVEGAAPSGGPLLLRLHLAGGEVARQGAALQHLLGRRNEGVGSGGEDGVVVVILRVLHVAEKQQRG
eukprot:scaffold14350_cov98-Isochrysis_galbana.AAC.9